MNGKSNEEIKKVREQAIKTAKRYIKDEKVGVIDSLVTKIPHEVNPLWFLAQSIEMLSQADIAYFAPGWEQARGCRIEHQCATEYGIDLVIEDFDPER